MAKKITQSALAVFLVFILLSCNKDELKAQRPVYLSVPEINLETSNTGRPEGSNHHNITTAFVFLGNEPIGTFETPFTVPILPTNSDFEVTIYPGINLNGVRSQKALYGAYEPIVFDTSAQPLDTTGRLTYTTTYKPSAFIDILEDFDGTGFKLEETVVSDTGFTVSGDPNEVFVNPLTGMSDGNVGKIVLTDKNNQFELSTINSFAFSNPQTNAYIEITYRCNSSFTVGVFANSLAGTTQAPTATILPSDEWKKIYINLITEISSNTNANNFEIFFGGIKPNDVDTATIFLDNLKLVYN